MSCCTNEPDCDLWSTALELAVTLRKGDNATTVATKCAVGTAESVAYRSAFRRAGLRKRASGDAIGAALGEGDGKPLQRFAARGPEDRSMDAFAPSSR
jgi:hypothetical protein